MSSSRRSRLGSIAALGALFIGFTLYQSRRPPTPVPATASDTLFSAERAMRHVRAIAQRPHPIGSIDHARVRDYIRAELRTLGLDPEIQAGTAVGTRFPEAGHVENVVARLPGTNRTGKVVLLVAHYDGVGAAPAAGDDAAGSAVLLETLHAILAGRVLRNDVLALFTDGEEAGLLGAELFAARHPAAPEVGVVINFDNRGTGGRALMFQTAPDNRDVVRVFRRSGGSDAASFWSTIYRFLPNDTDLSELFALGAPALNFAFADGVERYHTAEDDPDHLDPGSVQQVGDHAVALTRIFGAEPLPRPPSDEAVFFAIPLVGMVIYPESWSRPLGLIAVGLLLWALLSVRRRDARWVRGLLLGVVGLVLSVGLAALATFGLARFAGPGAAGPGWRGSLGSGMALLALGIVLLCWALARRWANPSGLHLGPLLVWTGAAVWVTWVAAPAGYFLLWPALLGSVVAGLGPDRGRVASLARWAMTLLGVVLVVPIIWGIGLIALGVTGPGAVAIGALAAFLAWLLVPELERVAGDRRWSTSLATLAIAVLLIGIGLVGGARSTTVPTRSLLAYAQDADGTDAWLTTPDWFARPGSWEAQVLGQERRKVVPRPARGAPGSAPQWLARVFGMEFEVAAAPAPWIALERPNLSVLSDSGDAERRRLVVRITPARGTTGITVRVTDARVMGARLDGRVVDPSRYRWRPSVWAVSFSAPPDSGFTLDLDLSSGSSPALELIAQWTGLPTLPGRPIPPRPPGTVASQSGDITVSRRVVRLDPAAGG